MGWTTPDVYGQPEHFGLKILGSIEWAAESYEFNMTVVWQDPVTGQLFYASDSGCSCPSPYENYTSRDALTPLDGIQPFIDFTDKALEGLAGDLPQYFGQTAAVENLSRVRGQTGELIQKMRLALRHS